MATRVSSLVLANVCKRCLLCCWLFQFALPYLFVANTLQSTEHIDAQGTSGVIKGVTNYPNGSQPHSVGRCFLVSPLSDTRTLRFVLFWESAYMCTSVVSDCTSRESYSKSLVPDRHNYSKRTVWFDKSPSLQSQPNRVCVCVC